MSIVQNEVVGQQLVSSECKCVVVHAPAALVIETHHILPLSWGGTKEKSNQVRVCAQTHYNIHWLLNWFVRNNGNPTAREAGWSHFAYSYACLAWSQRIEGHPTPFWLPEWPPIHVGGDPANFDRLAALMGWDHE